MSSFKRFSVYITTIMLVLVIAGCGFTNTENTKETSTEGKIKTSFKKYARNVSCQKLRRLL